jgi:hypothetical protein
MGSFFKKNVTQGSHWDILQAAAAMGGWDRFRISSVYANEADEPRFFLDNAGLRI